MAEQIENKDPQIQEETITSVTEALKSKTTTETITDEKVETSDNMTEETPESETNGHKEEIEGEESKAVENVTSTAEESGEAKPTTEEKEDNVKSTNQDEQATQKDQPLSSTVAQHYNEIPAGTKATRKDSRIFYLRNFNNWVKSVIINEFMEKIKRKKRTSDDINVLDLGCGKGGDLLKWDKARVDHVVLADIAETSIEQCKERYAKLQRDRRGNRYSKDRLFTTEFFAADCTKEVLSEKYKKKDLKLDMTSCQFAFHYSFESYEQADIMLKNACENLRPGGYFVGTTPDANKLVKRIKECKADSFGNSVFNIKPENRDQFPLFGGRYMFYLEGVVDCPEFFVHLPTLEALAAKYNMKLVWKKNFHDIFAEYQRHHSSLLNKMNALEQYPASGDRTLVGGSESQYKSARDLIDKKGYKQAGTLSADEWEVAGLYIGFAFEKIDVNKEQRESRKRQRGRSHERSSHGDSRRHSSSSKRSKKEESTGEEVYEVKDEIYEAEADEADTTTTGNTSNSEQTKDVVVDTTTVDTATVDTTTTAATTTAAAEEETKDVEMKSPDDETVTDNQPDSSSVDQLENPEENAGTEGVSEGGDQEEEAAEADADADAAEADKVDQ